MEKLLENHPVGMRTGGSGLGSNLASGLKRLLGKRIDGSWNMYEALWLAAFSIIAVVSTVSSGDTFFGFTVFFSGVLCVLLAAKGNVMTYVFGVYNVAGYAWIAYQNGLFGELALNLAFFMPMNIIGFIVWRKKLETPQRVSMRRLRPAQLALVGVAAVAGTAALGYGLSQIAGQNSPYLDAVTNVLSVIATLLMVARFREQWACYIILDGFTVAMWALRLVAGSPDGLIMVVMWSAYLVNAFYGYYVWSKNSKAAATGDVREFEEVRND